MLLAVAASVCFVPRGTRQAMEFTLLEAKFRVSGAQGEDFYQLAERVYQAGGSPERVRRLCNRAETLSPKNRWRLDRLMLKAHYHSDIVPKMDRALAAGEGFARMGQFNQARREYRQVLEWDLAFSTRWTGERAERARTGFSPLPPLPWAFK